MGYKTQEIEVANRTQINVVLEDDVTGLDEVVVIGYGSVRRRDLTGAVSSVKSDDLAMAPVANAVEAMQGRVAGLDITRNDGRASGEVSILLRGNRSLSGNNAPIYIIDGMQGDISNLNPNDIASVDILKDASSTAIYGSAGANGVIIVTTKQAEKGKVQIDFNAYVGVNTNGRYPSALRGDAWLDYLRESYRSTYPGTNPTNRDIFSEWSLDPNTMERYIANGKWVDWVDETLRTGIQQNYNLSVRGGSERTQAHFSLGYNSIQGIYRNDQSDMYTMRAGVTHQVKNWLTTGVLTGVSWRDGESRGSRLNKTFDIVPLGDAYDANGNINPYPIEGMSVVSPLADDVSGAYKNNSKSLNLTINPFVELLLAKGLTLRSQVGTSLSYSRGGTFNSDHTYMKLSGSSSQIRDANVSNRLGYNYTWENIATYHTTIAGDHDLTTTLVSSWEHNQREDYSLNNSGFLYDEHLWYSLQAGTIPGVSSGYTMSKKMSVVGRVNYSYKGKYLLTVSSRTDGVTQLSRKWDTFPAAAVAWRVSDEGFMEGLSGWLDNMKLRFGYGVTGNSNIAAYSTKTEVTSSGLDALNLGAGELQTSVLTQAVGNEQLGWEKSYNLNIGLDLSLFRNRLDASIEYYDTDTKDVLYRRSLPYSGGGFTAKNAYTMTGNIARMHNHGVELTLTGRPIVSKDFRWESTVTFARNWEKVNSIDLGSGTTVDDLVSLGLFIGHPKNTVFGIKKLGIWQKDEAADAAVFGLLPGDVKAQSNLTKVRDGVWKGIDKDGNEVEYTENNPYTIDASDRIIYGQSSPKWTGGWQNSFYWKNFDLNVFATARWGHRINAGLLGFFGYGSNTLPDTYNYWTESNPTNDFPRPYFKREDTKYSSPTQSLSNVDGSYVKIKNITLGYRLPQKVTTGIGLSSLRVYATMYNPFIITKDHLLKGTDPETGADDSFPLFRQVVFGVNISF